MQATLLVDDYVFHLNVSTVEDLEQYLSPSYFNYIKNIVAPEVPEEPEPPDEEEPTPPPPPPPPLDDDPKTPIGGGNN